MRAHAKPKFSLSNVDEWLGGPDAVRILEIARSLDAEDLGVILDDIQRRVGASTGAGQQCLGALRMAVQNDRQKLLAIVERVAQLRATMDGLRDALDRARGALDAAFLLLAGATQQGSDLPHGISNTRHWTDQEISEQLEEVKRKLGWEATKDKALNWWQAFELENAQRRALLLRLAEELLNRKATITEFFQAYVYSNTGNVQANLHYLDYSTCKKQASGAKVVQPHGGGGVPRSLDDGLARNRAEARGWDPGKLDGRLTELMASLDWHNTTGSPRKWWEAFEKKHEGSKIQVLWLAEELAKRKATITEFFFAYVYSNTEVLQANLHYLDYTRLKKEEERRSKDAAAKARGEKQRERVAQLLPELVAEGPLPELSVDDVALLAAASRHGMDAELVQRLDRAIEAAKARISADHTRKLAERILADPGLSADEIARPAVDQLEASLPGDWSLEQREAVQAWIAGARRHFGERARRIYGTFSRQILDAGEASRWTLDHVDSKANGDPSTGSATDRPAPAGVNDEAT